MKNIFKASYFDAKVNNSCFTKFTSRINQNFIQIC